MTCVPALMQPCQARRRAGRRVEQRMRGLRGLRLGRGVRCQRGGHHRRAGGGFIAARALPRAPAAARALRRCTGPPPLCVAADCLCLFACARKHSRWFCRGPGVCAHCWLKCSQSPLEGSSKCAHLTRMSPLAGPQTRVAPECPVPCAQRTARPAAACGGSAAGRAAPAAAAWRPARSAA